MAAANESQGLKIAVSICVALVVILGVSCYFLFSNYTTSEANLAKAQTSQRDAEKTSRRVINEYNELKAKLGFGNIEDHDQVKDSLKKFDDTFSNKVGDITGTVEKMVREAQGRGASSQELANLSQQSQKLKADLLNELNRGFYVPALDKMTELLANNTKLLTELGIEYQSLRGNLESANQVNADALDVEKNARKKAEEDNLAHLSEHEQKRAELVSAVDALKTSNTNLNNELAELKSRYRQFQDEKTKEYDTLLKQYKSVRDQLERRDEIILDHADGYITFVNYSQQGVNIARTSANRGTGAKPQMRFAVFDRNAPGIPNEKPKGSIELTQVGDHESVATIINTRDSMNPIRAGDIIYSPSWSPNEPRRFALIGKLDINRDGKDDRADVKRAIEASGGMIEYDLPPPGLGKETGKMTPACAWYVIDDRPPFFPPTKFKPKDSEEDLSQMSAFNKRSAEVITDARALGIRPLRLERLMAEIGYTPESQSAGRLETINKKERDKLLYPEGKSPEAAKKLSEIEGEKPAAKAEETKDANADTPKGDKDDE